MQSSKSSLTALVWLGWSRLLTHHRPVRWGWRGSLRCRTVYWWLLSGSKMWPPWHRGGCWLRNTRSLAGYPGPFYTPSRSLQSPVAGWEEKGHWANAETDLFGSNQCFIGILSYSNKKKMMISDTIGLPRTQRDPSWAALRPAPAELRQTPGRSSYRLQPPALACGMPSQSFWLLGAAPIKTWWHSRKDGYRSSFWNH